MNLKELLTQHNFPESVINALTASGITTLHPPQAEAIRKGRVHEAGKECGHGGYPPRPVKP